MRSADCCWTHYEEEEEVITSHGRIMNAEPVPRSRAVHKNFLWLDYGSSGFEDLHFSVDLDLGYWLPYLLQSTPQVNPCFRVHIMPNNGEIWGCASRMQEVQKNRQPLSTHSMPSGDWTASLPSQQLCRGRLCWIPSTATSCVCSLRLFWQCSRSLPQRSSRLSSATCSPCAKRSMQACPFIP